MPVFLTFETENVLWLFSLILTHLLSLVSFYALENMIIEKRKKNLITFTKILPTLYV